MIGLFKTKICLENSSKVTTLLDSSIEINVITRKLIEDINLAMREDPKLELVFYNNYSHFFLSFYEDVEIVIKRFKIRYPIFVIEASNHDIVLSQYFLNFVKFSPKYKLDRIFSIITHLYMDQIAIICILIPQDPVNQK